MLGRLSSRVCSRALPAAAGAVRVTRTRGGALPLHRVNGSSAFILNRRVSVSLHAQWAPSVATTRHMSAQTGAHKTEQKDNSYALTPEQKQFFHENGYVTLYNWVEEDHLQRMKDRAEEIVRTFAKSPDAISVFSTREQSRRSSDDYFLSSGDKIRCFFEEFAFDKNGKLRTDIDATHTINKIGHALHELEPAFRTFANSPKMHQLIKSLGMHTEPVLLQGMYIFKQPRIGGEVTPHQDSTFLFTEPASTVGVWLAVEDATLENGCLWAVPGSHRLGTIRRFIRNPSGSGTLFDPPAEENFSLEGAVALPVPKGTMVLLHGDLVHFSYDNKSPKSRHAFTVHMIDGKCHYPASNWLQREDGKEQLRLTGTN